MRGAAGQLGQRRRCYCPTSTAGTARSRVPGLGREFAEINADLLQRLIVFAAGVLPEDQLGIGRAMQPAVMLDLVLELARRPPGIAERQDRALRAVAAGNRLENVEGCGEADPFVDWQGGILDEEI